MPFCLFCREAAHIPYYYVQEEFISYHSGCLLYLYQFYNNVIKMQNADPEQTLRSVTSDLGLHCFTKLIQLLCVFTRSMRQL